MEVREVRRPRLRCWSFIGCVYVFSASGVQTRVSFPCHPIRCLAHASYDACSFDQFVSNFSSVQNIIRTLDDTMKSSCSDFVVDLGILFGHVSNKTEKPSISTEKSDGTASSNPSKISKIFRKIFYRKIFTHMNDDRRSLHLLLPFITTPLTHTQHISVPIPVRLAAKVVQREEKQRCKEKLKSVRHRVRISRTPLSPTKSSS